VTKEIAVYDIIAIITFHYPGVEHLPKIEDLQACRSAIFLAKTFDRE
jgi:hypothetical protein